MPTRYVIRSTGGPEALEPESFDLEAPGPNQVLIRQTAIGLNFIDTYHRSGLYPLTLPHALGMEAAGTVEAVGSRVEELAPGDRVGYATLEPGAYTTHRLCPAEKLIRLPNAISDEAAAASLLKGMTAEYLIRRTYAVQPGETVLLHAAAGGVGLLACQWLKHLGARVIGTVGSDEKAELAKAHGCDFPIVYTRESFPERVKTITNGEGLTVVYDSVGRATMEGSLDCLQRRGLYVSFGNASGKPPPLDLGVLSTKGALYATRPSLMHYTATRQELTASANALFDVVMSGAVRINIAQRFSLSAVGEAHRALQGRRTVGSTILLPD